MMKKHQPGKWRLITDLSYPEGTSVNDAIDPALCSLSYITVDQVALRALSLGKGALIAKTDIQSAYRLVPVHPSDRRWLGMRWKGQIYVDGMLPFGLRSAPKIFNAMADGLEWCISDEGVKDIFHYLDDFAVVGPPDSNTCQRYLSTLKRVCQDLGIPLAQDKEDGPCTTIVLLGIVIDTIKGELRLPEDKLRRLLLMVAEWEHRSVCTRKELESLIGVLQHATKVVQPGRTFLRRAIDLLSVGKKKHHHIRLNAGFKSDMAWWKTFSAQWNGASLIIHPGSKEATITSDASGHWGCGAWHGREWFQLQWNKQSEQFHIAAKELIPILIAAIIWGKHWKGHRVTAFCDNMAVVSVLNSRSCQDKVMMQMLRGLFFIEASLQFKLSACHVAGIRNELADDLSRDRLSAFRARKQDALPDPTSIPISSLQWLLHPNLEWTSPSWMTLFSTSVQRE